MFPGPASSTTYIDSSVVLRSLLKQNGQFQRWEEIYEAVSSELLIVECNRVIDRCRLQGQLDDREVAQTKEALQEFLEGLTLLSIEREVLKRASGSFSTVVGSLDAIHLSTALVWREKTQKEVTLLTHDQQLQAAAQAEGLKVLL